MSATDPDLLDLIREATKAAVERTLRTTMPTRTPGTVDTFDPVTQICGVKIDGDEDVTPGIPNLSGSWPHRGSRVVVEFRPPSGIALVQVMEPKGAPHCLCSSSAVQSVTGGAGSTLLTNTDTITGLTDYFDLTAGILTVVVPGWYDIGLGVLTTAGASAGRRFAGLVVDGATTDLGVGDVQVGAAGQWIATGGAYRELNSGSTIQPRGISSATVDYDVTELSARWRARRTTVS